MYKADRLRGVEPWDQHFAESGTVKVLEVQWRFTNNVNDRWIQVYLSDGRVFVQDGWFHRIEGNKFQQHPVHKPWSLLKGDPEDGVYAEYAPGAWEFPELPEDGKWIKEPVLLK